MNRIAKVVDLHQANVRADRERAERGQAVDLELYLAASRAAPCLPAPSSRDAEERAAAKQIAAYANARRRA